MLSSDRDVSSDFLALCDSQLALLTESLGASQTAVYLTQTWQPTNGTKLVPVAVYPHTDLNLLDSLPEIKQPKTKVPSLLLEGKETTFSGEQSITKVLSTQYSNREQLVVPLMYKEVVMGLLITHREKPKWKSSELAQVEHIAETIAIACLLDQRQAWYEQNLIDMQEIRIVEQRQLSDFLHQLRNPLTALRTFGKLLLKRLLPEDQNKKIVDSLLRETEHLQELLKQFENQGQEISEPKSLGGSSSSFLLPSLTLEPVNILTVLEPILMSAQTVAESKELEIIVELSELTGLIQANPRALAEVLQNLIDNAIKYTPAGGKIKITTLTKPGLQGIAIHDTGYGIPKAVQNRIFERNYRGVQAESDIPGTGLGLAIAKDLVEQMHGTIELISPNHHYFEHSSTGDGTTFIVWLPLTDSH